MKTKTILLITVVGMFTFSSCKKCYECGPSGGIKVETCKTSSETQAEFNDRISALESVGYDCN